VTQFEVDLPCGYFPGGRRSTMNEKQNQYLKISFNTTPKVNVIS